MNLLLEYDWPGNIRELKNLVERLVIISDDEEIDESYLPSYIQLLRQDKIIAGINNDFQNTAGLTLKEIIEEHEKKVLSYYITNYRPLKKCAEILGMDLTTLFRKKKRYGL
jgi:DNA-binding NtrC family response regulator